MSRLSVASIALALLLASWLTWRWTTPAPVVVATPFDLNRVVTEYTTFLDNGRVCVGVCPQLGRIVWFSISGSNDNVLWLNDAQAFIEQQAEHGWANWGGDKLWPAPQADWPQVMGRRWPADPVLDGLSWKLLDHGPLSCTIESQPSPYWGVVIRRRITLAADLPLVEIHNTLVRVSDCDWPVNAWSVTQVRHPQYCLMGVADHANSPQTVWQWLSEVPAGAASSGIVQKKIGAMQYTPPHEPPTKIGTTGQWIAAVYPDVIFLQETSPSNPNGRYADNACAQAYSDARYMELELLGSIGTLSKGRQVEQTIRWQLLDRPTGQDVDMVLRLIGQSSAQLRMGRAD